jgi:hypothetical protein
MTRAFLFICLFAGVSWAQTDKPSMETFRKEALTLGAAVDSAVSAAVPGRSPFQSGAKATYLEGYGAVVTIETALEGPRNPFTSPKTPAETRAIMTQRLANLQQALEKLLQERTAKLESLASTDSISLVVYIFNANPGDAPDFPSQVVVTAKKEDPTHVKVQKF